MMPGSALGARKDPESVAHAIRDPRLLSLTISYFFFIGTVTDAPFTHGAAAWPSARHKKFTALAEQHARFTVILFTLQPKAL
jgi:hypothetical protein